MSAYFHNTKAGRLDAGPRVPRWEITIPEADRRALTTDFAPEVARLKKVLGRMMPRPRISQ